MSYGSMLLQDAVGTWVNKDEEGETEAQAASLGPLLSVDDS